MPAAPLPNIRYSISAETDLIVEVIGVTSTMSFTGPWKSTQPDGIAACAGVVVGHSVGSTSESTRSTVCGAAASMVQVHGAFMVCALSQKPLAGMNSMLTAICG